MTKYSIFFLLMIYGTLMYAQNDIKIMSYNLLIYPEGQMVNRIDTLSKILDFYEPDLLLVQELRSEQGLQNIEQELNALFGNYSATTYVPQISNPSNSWRLQQNLVYNEAVFEMVSEQVIETPYRDINYAQFRILSENGTPSTDLLHTYNTHLKSSRGSTNEQLRLSMVEVLVDHISQLPPESNVVVAGDFNVYSGGEPAYELLLRTNGTNTLHDPIDMPGWADSNFSNNEILTQSTRSSSLPDGSGGGMDDRFDFILLSEQLMNPNANIVYQEESYAALGNNGTCYNQDLIDCSIVDNVPFEILRSLYHMSDHLPIVLTLDKNEVVSTNESNLSSEGRLIEIAPNPFFDHVNLEMENVVNFEVRIYDINGALLQTDRNINRIELESFSSGIYLLELTDLDSSRKVFKKIVK